MMDSPEYGEPAWPVNLPPLEKLLELAFYNNIIDNSGHEAIKRARDV